MIKRAALALLLISALVVACTGQISEIGEDRCSEYGPGFAMEVEQERLEGADFTVLRDASHVAIALCSLEAPLEGILLTRGGDRVVESFGGSLTFSGDAVHQMIFFPPIEEGTYMMTSASGWSREVEVPDYDGGCVLSTSLESVVPRGCGSLSVVAIEVSGEAPQAIEDGLVYLEAFVSKNGQKSPIESWVVDIAVRPDAVVLTVALDVLRPSSVVVDVQEAFAPGGIRYSFDSTVEFEVGEL